MVCIEYSQHSPRQEDVLERIALEVADRGWSVTEGFLPPLLVSQLASDLQEQWQAGAFRHAGIGRGKDLRIQPEVRTDRVNWLEPARCTGAQQLYLNVLEELRLTLNRRLFLGLFEFEGHQAIYPPGSFYRKHLDQFRGTEQRTVTCILYLNQQWQKEDGGQLLIYADPLDESRYDETLPVGGRLVTFLSARFVHEVLPARRERLSITGWFKRRDTPLRH